MSLNKLILTDLALPVEAAIKTFSKTSSGFVFPDDSMVLQEILALKKLYDCENIIDLEAIFEDSSGVHLVLRFAKKGSLY